MRRTLVLGMLVIGLTGCGLFGARGSGELATETRNVDVFSGIDLKGIGEVTLVQGPDQSINVTTDDNLLDRLRTEMRGDVLTIYFAQGTRDVTALEISIETPTIGSITNSGSGSIRGTGRFEGDRLDLTVAGSGEIIVEAAMETLDVEVTGSGDAVIRGESTHFRADVSGSGSVLASDLRAQRASIDISGSGRVEVHADRSLDVAISGSGVVAYTGEARLSSNITGSGAVRARRADDASD